MGTFPNFMSFNDFKGAQSENINFLVLDSNFSRHFMLTVSKHLKRRDFLLKLETKR